jgi:hypothetical protein
MIDPKIRDSIVAAHDTVVRRRQQAAFEKLLWDWAKFVLGVGIILYMVYGK